MALIKCPDCENQISDHACVCIHCGYPIHRLMQQTEADDSPHYLSESYLTYRRPIIQITVVGIFFLMVTTIITKYFRFDFSSPEQLFIVYANFFLAFWVSYFTSRQPILGHDDHLNPLQSLRRLLCETAVHWPASDIGDTQHRQQLVKSFRRKSSSSIQVLAIMIAVSILILDRVTTILDSLRLPDTEDIAIFRFLLLAITGIAAIISFVCFVISVDALDVVFNKFKSVRAGQTIIRHYYQSTINPKYYGLISMLVSIICLSAYYHFYIGCLTIGITLYVGYFHWFPDFKDDVKTDDDKTPWRKRLSLSSLEHLVLSIVVVLPFILWLNDRIL